MVVLVVVKVAVLAIVKSIYTQTAENVQSSLAVTLRPLTDCIEHAEGWALAVRCFREAICGGGLNPFVTTTRAAVVMVGKFWNQASRVDAIGRALSTDRVLVVAKWTRRRPSGAGPGHEFR